MSHVDDGTLHALLDGALRAESPERAAAVEAHLAVCPDCRARAASAAEVRAEASEILDVAIPATIGVDGDFSDVVARAEGGALVAPPRRRFRRQARWTRGVAWAASLVLALGTGYLIRDMAGPSVADPPASAARSEALESDRADGDPAPARSVTEEPVARPAAGTPEPRPAPAERGPVQSAEDAGRADARSNGDAPPAAPLAREPVVEGRALADRAEPDRTLPDRAAAGRPEAEARAPARVQAMEPQAQPSETLAVTGAAARRLRADTGVAVPRESAAGPVAESDVSAGAPPPAGADRWVAATLEEARAALDGPLYLLPRAELVEIYRTADTELSRVMTLQRLQTGVPVQVMQWRGGEPERDWRDAEVSAVSDPMRKVGDATLPGASVARVVRDAYVLQLTGSLPEGLLSVLGETADPAP